MCIFKIFYALNSINKPMCSSPYYLLYSNNILYVLRKKPTVTHLEPQVLIIERTLRSNLKETAVYCSVNYLFLLLDKGSAILIFCPKCNYDASINLLIVHIGCLLFQAVIPPATNCKPKPLYSFSSIVQ